MSGIRSCEMIKLSACLKNYLDHQSCEILWDMITMRYLKLCCEGSWPVSTKNWRSAFNVVKYLYWLRYCAVSLLIRYCCSNKSNKFCIVIQPLSITQTRKRKKEIALDLPKFQLHVVSYFFSGCLKSVAFSSSAASEPTETLLQNTWRFRGSETYPLLIEGQTLKGSKSDTTIPPWKVSLCE